jgi:polysaccharide export outer membrane protein
MFRFASKLDLLLVVFAFLICVAPQLHAAEKSVPHRDTASYVLGPGDLIEISVYGESELTIKFRLEENGILSYPFLGDIRVAGVTVQKLESLVYTGLERDYLVDPDVRVSVVEYRPVYVNGQVKKPGGYPYIPGLTVQKAVTLAGGFTQLASKRNMFLVPEGSDNKKRLSVGLDSKVAPGDTLIIEEGLF